MTPRPDPLLKEALPLPPVATRSFDPTETMAVFAEIYDRSAPSPHEVDVKVVVVPDGSSSPVFAATETQTMAASATTRTHGYRAEIPLNGMAPGDYVLRLEASSRAGNHTAAREIPFTVGRSLAVPTH